MSQPSLAYDERTPHRQAGDDEQPRALGKYRILFELGRGGMANVFLAVTQGTGGVSKLVVLKALLPELASEPGSLAMFLDEARLAVQLNHGNVVQTYEVGQAGDRHVIVMEYLEGQSLAAVLRRAERQGEALPLALHLRVIIGVLEGLRYIHELKGYDGKRLEPVHRDVSPQNVFITYDGRTKLLDFGIAKAGSSTTQTVAGTVKGKLAYMSPEQMSGSTVDCRTDVYAVGCMLWAAATGRKLWKDVMDVHILRDVMLGAIPTPRSVNPSCDPELERIVMKALAAAPERYASCFELQEELERFCDRIGAHERQRDLARFVSKLFADTRADVTAHVERKLSAVDCAVAFLTPEQTGSITAVPEVPSQSAFRRTVSASTLESQSRPQAARKRWIWLAAPGVALALVAAYLVVAATKPRAMPKSPAPVAVAASGAGDIHPDIKLQLRAFPGASKLFLDGRELDGNPVVRVLPSDGKVHQLRAVLEGYQSTTAEFTATHDDAVAVHLEKLASPEPPAASNTERRLSPVHPPRPVQHAHAESSDCAQPFYFVDGIKKVKPACL